mgnify:CR=1 FL=1
MYIYNVSLGKLEIAGLLDVPFFGQLTWTPPNAGEYYFYVKPASSSTDLLGKEYMFSVAPETVKVNKVNVGAVTSSADYGVYAGKHWVSGGSAVIQGTVDGLTWGDTGYQAVSLQMDVRSRDRKEVKTVYILTKENGAFKISLILPYSEGKSGAFKGYGYVHTYDEQEIDFLDLARTKIYSNVKSILNVTK